MPYSIEANNLSLLFLRAKHWKEGENGHGQTFSEHQCFDYYEHEPQFLLAGPELEDFSQEYKRCFNIKNLST